jgi:hypothetical protein
VTSNVIKVSAALAIAAACLGGCGHRAAETGAKQAAQQYLEAFCQQDWTRAYAALDPASRAQDSADQYTQWVTDYRRRLGFDVDSAVVVWCRETGDLGAVGAALSGHDGTRKLTKEVALSLHRHEGRWWVVLPAAAAGFTGMH